MNNAEHIQWFRSAAPYINAFRGKTFVIALSGEMVNSALFTNLTHDIALCHHLGIKLVLVHGSRNQIDERLAASGMDSSFHNNVRISDNRSMPVILQAINQVHNTISARLSMGLPNTPMSGSDITVVSGNFVTGMPLGIIDGIDMQHSGKVRTIDVDSIRKLLEQHIVLLPNIGYSKSGELFNLPAEELAAKIAIDLKAEKLIFFNRDYIQNPRTDQFSTGDCEQQVKSADTPAELRDLLNHAIEAVGKDVQRVHIIDDQLDGGLLQELFTREGAGMMVTNRFYEGLRQANIDDIGGILELIGPLEQSGILAKRSREQIELEIASFQVIEKDRMIIACIACIPDHDSAMAEVACVAVHADYRNLGLGDQLLSSVEIEAKRNGIQHLFILTTRSSHWFLEKGFEITDLDFLPETKRQSYNVDRNSRIMTKRLDR